MALFISCAVLSPHSGSAKLAEVICDDSTRLERQLLTGQGAKKLGRGMRGPDALMEVWITPSTGDWVMVQSYANGTSCIVAMGEHWEALGSPTDPA